MTVVAVLLVGKLFLPESKPQGNAQSGPSLAPPVAPAAAAAPPPAKINPEVEAMAAKLVAGKMESVVAEGMIDAGIETFVPLSETMSGIVMVDNFGEKPKCLVAFSGVGPPLTKGVGKWNLTYLVTPSHPTPDSDVVFTGEWPGAASPARIYFDQDPSFVETIKSYIAVKNTTFRQGMANANTIRVKHSATMEFTYDAGQLRLAQAVARRACNK